MFQYEGADLLKKIFPQFDAALESELTSLVRTGEEKNIRRVLAVLRNYHGEVFLHNIVREIIKASPQDAEWRDSIVNALEATDVLEGDDGRLRAYEQKLADVTPWLTDDNEKIRVFAERYTQNLKQQIEEERKRVKEERLLRRHQYGEPLEDEEASEKE